MAGDNAPLDALMEDCPDNLSKILHQHPNITTHIQEVEFRIFELFEFVDARTSELTAGLLEIHIIVTDGDYRRQGMARKLAEVTEDLARNNRLRGVKMACTSAYSAHLARSLNYKEVYSLAYADYNGNSFGPVFNPPDIHSHLRLFIKVF